MGFFNLLLSVLVQFLSYYQYQTTHSDSVTTSSVIVCILTRQHFLGHISKQIWKIGR